MLKLTILGYWAGFPNLGSGSSSYLLQAPLGNVVLDMGSGSAASYTAQHHYETLQGLVLSHWHHDHAADLLHYQHAWKVLMKQGIVQDSLPLYAPPIPSYLHPLLDPSVLDIHLINEQAPFELAGIQFEAFPVQHTILCYGMRMHLGNESIAYTGDTAYFPQLSQVIKGCQTLLCEATNFDGSLHSSGQGHMSPQEALHLAHEAEVDQVILTHLPSDLDLDQARLQLAAKYPNQWAVLAADYRS